MKPTLLPTPIAIVWNDYHVETRPFHKLHRIVDAYEALLNFKRLLIPCAYYQDATYGMCSIIAHAYPDHASAIAKVVMESVGITAQDAPHHAS